MIIDVAWYYVVPCVLLCICIVAVLVLRAFVDWNSK